MRERLWLALLATLTFCTPDAEPGTNHATAEVMPNGCDKKACKREGLCTMSGAGKCIAASSQDCRPSLVCWSEGRCEAEGGVCVPNVAAILLLRMRGAS